MAPNVGMDDSAQLQTIAEDEELETPQAMNDQTLRSLHEEKTLRLSEAASTPMKDHSRTREVPPPESAPSSCISFECIVKLLCEDPDKQVDAGMAESYRSGLSAEFANRPISAPKAYRMKSLDDSGRFTEAEEEDEWETQGMPKAYSMRAGSCF